MIPEARLDESEAGRAPVSDGWYVVNARDTAWLTSTYFGAAGVFESEAIRFDEVGFTLSVLLPGQPSGLYHAETSQEDFLVLSGECLVLVEGEERPLRTWDFVHCPPETEHIFVGAGDGPCIIFMTGGRTTEKRTVYPRAEVALRHGAGVEEETQSPAQAYAPFARWESGRPKVWNELPWA
jgi:uncharacterized cupin superfamily protein